MGWYQDSDNLQKLPKVQNTAARLVFRAKHKEHTTPLLIQLHWLTVCELIKFKLLTLAYKNKHKTTVHHKENHLKPPNYSDGNMFLLVQYRTHESCLDSLSAGVFQIQAGDETKDLLWHSKLEQRTLTARS